MRKSFFDRHAEAIATGVYSEGFISGMKMALNNDARKRDGWSISRSAPRVNHGELGLLLRQLQQLKPRVSPEQTAKGIAWLRNEYKTPKGTVRKTNPFGAISSAILDNFSHFTVVGFHEVRRGYHLPVYRAYGTNGNTFDYVAGSWQDGYGLEILSVDKAT